MNNESRTPALSRFIRKLNKFPPSPTRYMNINSLAMMLIVPIFVQMQRMTLADPNGLAPVPLVIVGLLLMILALMLEIFVVIAFFLGISWLVSVPNYLAVGVVHGIAGAENRYKLAHVTFYTRLKGNLLLAGASLAIGTGAGIMVGIDFLISGYVTYTFAAVALLFVIPYSAINLLVMLLSGKKAREWTVRPIGDIQDIAKEKRSRLPLMAEMPSLDEMEASLLESNLGDYSEQEKASLLDEAAKRTERSPLVSIIIGVIVAVCFIMLFV